MKTIYVVATESSNPSEVFDHEADAYIASLGAGLRFDRDVHGMMEIYEGEKTVYMGCSMDSDDDLAKLEVMRDCQHYLGAHHSSKNIGMISEVVIDDGKILSVDGDDDASLCAWYQKFIGW